MWKLIDNHDIIRTLRRGQIIANHPSEVRDRLCIKSNHGTYITAVSFNKKQVVTMLPSEDLMDELWWALEKIS